MLADSIHVYHVTIEEATSITSISLLPLTLIYISLAYTLHCSIQGRKDWILMDSKYSDKMYLRNSVDDFSGASVIEPNSVDLKLYPRIAEIPFRQGNITPGDCILVPPGKFFIFYCCILLLLPVDYVLLLYCTLE